MMRSPVVLIALRHMTQQTARCTLCVGGMALGVGLLALSLAMGLGVRAFVLDALVRTLPLTMIEARPEGLDLGFLQMPQGAVLGPAPLDQGRLEALAQLPHVAHVYPKRDVALPLGAQGGAQLFGRALYADLFVTALPENLVQGPKAPGFVDLRIDQQVLTATSVIPMVIAPQLISLYNTSVAPALGTPTLKAEDLIGFEFDLVVGRSLMLGGQGARTRGLQRAKIVGVSPFAAPLGGTIPWRYASVLLAQYAAPQKAAGAVTGVIVEADSAQAIVGVTDSLSAQGLRVDEMGQKVRHVMWGAMGLTSLAGLLVLCLVACQTAFSLHVYVAERRRQWSILQAMGLGHKSLVGLIVAQAAALGAAGGLLGMVLAWGASIVADAALRRVWPSGLTRPETLFAFAPQLVAGCLSAALLASVLGAVGPAVSAAYRAVHTGLRD